MADKVINKVEVHPECAGRVNGGTKYMFLRVHRKEIETDYARYGPDYCKKKYNMTDKTFHAFWQRQGEDYRLNKLSEGDRQVMQWARAGFAELRHRVNELEDWRIEVEPVIEVGCSLIRATSAYLRDKVDNTALLEAAIRLDNSGEKSKK